MFSKPNSFSKDKMEMSNKTNNIICHGLQRFSSILNHHAMMIEDTTYSLCPVVPVVLRVTSHSSTSYGPLNYIVDEWFKYINIIETWPFSCHVQPPFVGGHYGHT